MKNILLTLTLISIFTFLSNDTQAQSKWTAPSSTDQVVNPFASDKASIKSGKKLYNQMCSICHGKRGKGDGMAGASLNPKPANFTSTKVQSQTDGAIFWKISEGNAPMASYKASFTEEQRWSLVNYIRTFKK